MKKPRPDFSKKVVSCGIIGNEHTSAVERPRFEMQGGRLFLVGTVPRGGSSRDWSAGVVSAVAWDQVTDYLMFDSDLPKPRQLISKAVWNTLAIPSEKF